MPTPSLEPAELRGATRPQHPTEPARPATPHRAPGGTPTTHSTTIGPRARPPSPTRHTTAPAERPANPQRPTRSTPRWTL